MLHRSKRVPQELFQEAVKQGRSTHSPHFSVKVYPLEGKELRFASAVSKKVEKTAVKRNKIRRRIASSVRSELSKLPNGYVVLVFAKAGVSKLKNPDFNKELLFLLRKALNV